MKERASSESHWEASIPRPKVLAGPCFLPGFCRSRPYSKDIGPSSSLGRH